MFLIRPANLKDAIAYGVHDCTGHLIGTDLMKGKFACIDRDTEAFSFLKRICNSDHIGSADEIIREFHPKKVYAEPYDDSMVTVPAALWDNQYV